MTDTNKSNKIEPIIQHIIPDINKMFHFMQTQNIESQYLLYVENVKGKMIIRAGLNQEGGVHYEDIIKEGEHARLELTPENGLIFSTGELQ